MSKAFDAAKAWADMMYPTLVNPNGAYARIREKQRIAFMLGFERGYKVAARARLSAVEYMTNDNDDAKAEEPSEMP